MSKTQKSIVGGMTVLGITGIVCKLVGVLFSIPLTWLIGADGVALFQLVFPTYNLLLTVSSAGLPVAISRMVSHCLARDDPRNARRVFRIALWMLTALGFVCTILMLAGNQFLAARVGEPLAAPRIHCHCALPDSGMRAFRLSGLYAGAAEHGAHRHLPAD